MSRRSDRGRARFGASRVPHYLYASGRFTGWVRATASGLRIAVATKAGPQATNRNRSCVVPSLERRRSGMVLRPLIGGLAVAVLTACSMTVVSPRFPEVSIECVGDAGLSEDTCREWGEEMLRTAPVDTARLKLRLSHWERAMCRRLRRRRRPAADELGCALSGPLISIKAAMAVPGRRRPSGIRRGGA